VVPTRPQSSDEVKRRSGSRRRWAAALALFAICALLRFGLVGRQGLWADELFSLAMATGHSLEHPAEQADPALGDYVERTHPAQPSDYSRYLEHERPAADPARVVRAVLRSDTSPPLYYLLLYGWTLVLGTSDVALRLFSVLWALACFPMLWSLARLIGGKAAQVPVCLLFTFAPLSVFYAGEGRMYSLLWFWTIATMWLTLRLWRKSRPGLFLLWVSVGAAGLLTHYFYAFILVAAVTWLFLHPGRLPRRFLCVGVVLVGLLVLPWYIQLPQSLAAWRVTGSWLNLRPGNYSPMFSLLYLPWSYFALRGVWGVPVWFDLLNGILYVAVGVVICARLRLALFTPRRRLLWMCVAAACLGLVVFDLLRATYVVAQLRYAIAGMPAAFLLAGFGLSRLPLRQRTLIAAVVVGMCLLAISRMYMNSSRANEPFRQVGELLTETTRGSDLVVVHSIPSGVSGVARYLEEAGPSEPPPSFASWVGQLEQRRTPEDVRRLAAGFRRIMLVKIHDVGEPAPQEDWLRQNATLVDERYLEAAHILYFVPRGADVFSEP